MSVLIVERTPHSITIPASLSASGIPTRVLGIQDITPDGGNHLISLSEYYGIEDFSPYNPIVASATHFGEPAQRGFIQSTNRALQQGSKVLLTSYNPTSEEMIFWAREFIVGETQSASQIVFVERHRVIATLIALRRRIPT